MPTNDVKYSRRQFLNLRRFVARTGPMATADYEPEFNHLDNLRDAFKILVVGAGGLGCELLKNLSLLGFGCLHVIDMDTIDVSNLNRQLLYTRADVGHAKAEIAARSIMARVPGCTVVPHFCRIEDRDDTFYRQFHIVVSGLDSVIARRWINAMLISLLTYNADGSVDHSSVIPLIDGGTEGFRGSVRVILPGVSACIDCALDLFPPQISYPLCTLAHVPRLPEHCIEYVRVLLWPTQNPWGESVPIDGDDPAHIAWILERAQLRATEFGIPDVDYRLTQGVIKRIIPAVASTNATVAAACASEAFKLATSYCAYLDNYLVYNDVDGVYTYAFRHERSHSCVACSVHVTQVAAQRCWTLQRLIERLAERFRLKSPSLTTRSSVTDGDVSLYIPNVPCLRQATTANLAKSLHDLHLVDSQEIYVSDPSFPSTLIFRLVFNE